MTDGMKAAVKSSKIKDGICTCIRMSLVTLSNTVSVAYNRKGRMKFVRLNDPLPTLAAGLSFFQGFLIKR